MRSSIALKVSLLVLGSTCLIFALVLLRSYTNSRELIRAEAETSARNLTALLANDIEQEFLIVETATKNLAGSLEIGTWDEKRLLERIKKMVSQNSPVYGSTVAFEPDTFKPGVKLFAPYFYRSKEGIKFEQLGTESYNYFSKEWFALPMKLRKPAWSEPYFDEGGGNVAMTTYSYPLFRTEGRPAGARPVAIVTADVSLKQLNKLVNGIRVYDTGFCFVTSDKGTTITSRDPERVMRMTLYDLVKMYNQPRGKEIVRSMLSKESGFEDIGPAFTGVDSFVAFTRINPPGWVLGAVLPKNELFAKVEALHRTTIKLAIAGIALLLIAAVLVARSISRPLRLMARETVKVAQGDLNIDLSSIRTTDEVGQLAKAFTRMTDGLKDRDRIKDTFGRYLTQEVVKRLLDSKDGLKLGGEIRDISIMMSDLRGFTALTSTMSPEQVIKFLNRYLGKMVDIILDHRGIIDEIIGDGILAFFGAPETLENHPELAVTCALKMQIAMEEINAQNEADGLPHLEMGIAVNTGDVVVGNIGSEKRAKYGAVGAQVNFTGRVESFTVGGQVLISHGTYERLSPMLDIRKTLQVEMKGVPGKVTLYDVRGVNGPDPVQLHDRDETMISLAHGIEVKVFGMAQKILEDTGRKATITDASLTTAKMLFEEAVIQWEDIRIHLTDPDGGLSEGEIYAKVMSIEPAGEGFQALARFTSVSSEAYKTLRKVIGS